MSATKRVFKCTSLVALSAMIAVAAWSGSKPATANTRSRYKVASHVLTEGLPNFLAVNSNSVVGGTDSITLTVGIASSTSADTQITVNCSAPSLVNASGGWPLVINIPAGQTSASITLSTNACPNGAAVNFTSHDLTTGVLFQPDTK